MNFLISLILVSMFSHADSVRFPISTTAATTKLVLDTPGTGAAGHGSSSTKIRRYTNTVSTASEDVTYADSATLGMSVTVVRAGLYFISMNDLRSSAGGFVGLSLNATGGDLTTVIYTVATGTRLIYSSAATSQAAQTSMVAYLAVGDVIRAHDDGACDCTGTYCTFVMVRIL